jgi:predicted TIM-barrel fold metal-dependent hydrolase
VCGHIGYLWTDERVAVARKHENVVIDTSAYTVRRYPTELVRFLKSRTGARKVLFGTNFPMIPHAQALDALNELGLDDATREASLGGNASADLRAAAAQPAAAPSDDDQQSRRGAARASASGCRGVAAARRDVAARA